MTRYRSRAGPMRACWLRLGASELPKFLCNYASLVQMAQKFDIGAGSEKSYQGPFVLFRCLELLTVDDHVVGQGIEGVQEFEVIPRYRPQYGKDVEG